MSSLSSRIYLCKDNIVIIEKANIRPVRPNTLKFTQVSISKLKATYQFRTPHKAKKSAQARFNLVQIVHAYYNYYKGDTDELILTKLPIL